MRDLSLYRGIGVEYTNWDGLTTNLCDCAYGYTGHDCSITMCPKGDDPLTSFSNYKTIQLVVDGPSGFSGTLGIVFEGETTTIPLSSVSDSVCEEQFEASKKFSDVTCTYTTTAIGTGTRRIFVIEFVSWPLTPQENNLYSHDGNPSIEEFRCDLTSMDSSAVSCSFTDLISTDIPGTIAAPITHSCASTSLYPLPPSLPPHSLSHSPLRICLLQQSWSLQSPKWRVSLL
jgi:hypothetical protein